MRVPLNETNGTVTASYGSGLVHTTVLTLPDGSCTWIRRPGPARTAPLAAPSAAAHLALAGIGDDPPLGVRPALPAQRGDELRYALPGPRSAAEILISGRLPDRHRAATLMRDLGLLLRTVHAVQPPADAVAQPPAALSRVAAWVDSPGPGTAARLHAVTRDALGPARWETAVEWLGALLNPPSPVLVHGGPGLGLLVPASAPGDAGAVLCGEDLSFGPWQLDVGWILGELWELSAFTCSDPPMTPNFWQGIATSFLSGHGGDPDPLIAPAAITRMLLHLHDFSLFVMWDETSARRYAGLVAELIDRHR